MGKLCRRSLDLPIRKGSCHFTVAVQPFDPAIELQLSL
jgi:hypothetical protein